MLHGKKLILRPFTPTDAEYEALVKLRNSVITENKSTVAIWKHGDANRDPEKLFRRVVVERDGELIAYGQYGETTFFADAFFLEANIHPEQTDAELTTRLFDHMATALKVHQPSKTFSFVRENEALKIDWLEENRFELDSKDMESSLEVAPFDPAPYLNLLDKVAAEGIEILSVTELQNRDPDWQRQLYELDYILCRDVPTPVPIQKRPFPQFVKNEYEHPNFLPDGWFIALDGGRNNGQYIGMCALFKLGGETETIGNGITGVIRSYRRRGIATALKVHAIRYAQSIGTKNILSGNEENNPMYQINLMLGFKLLPATLIYQK